MAVGKGIDVDKDATVVVRNKHNSRKTMGQSDENGTYIIEAGAHKHLTAHDKDGKLLFDGEVDTPAQQEKVPKEVWEKAKAMIDQLAEPTGSEPKAEDKAGEKPKPETKRLPAGHIKCVKRKNLLSSPEDEPMKKRILAVMATLVAVGLWLEITPPTPNNTRPVEKQLEYPICAAQLLLLLL